MRSAPSARLIVALFMVVPVVLIAAVLIALSSITASRIAENLGAVIVERATSAVRENVHRYLDSAVRTSDLYALRLQRGELAHGNLIAWEPVMFTDLVTSKDIASICFGDVNGNCTWLLRRHGAMELGRVNGARDGFAQEFLVDPEDGHVNFEHPSRTYHFDPRERPWYKTALVHDQPTWTPVYFWFGERGMDAEIGTGYTRIIRDPQSQEVVGVLVIDVTLAALSDFLQRLPLSNYGVLFMIDEQGLLVASSRGSVNTPEGERMSLNTSPDPIAVAAAKALQAAGASRDYSETVTIAGEPARLQAQPFNPQDGLHWTIISVVPERAFLAEAQAVKQRSIFIGLVAIVLVLGLALMLARMICQPIVAVRNHARRIGSGEFDSQLSLPKVREFRDLSTDLNQMGLDLKDCMEIRHALILANEVRQSLLPQAPPRSEGLDMFGYSRYCDEAGGDYFDFIDLAELPLHRTLIAIGDVMGHGIASALLMATARAALRATALNEGSLGVLMTRVNSVLARDARHERFMTMALGVIDPGSGILRWSSAGHDPPIVYSPVRGNFRETQGGDIPLGIIDGVTYDENEVAEIEPGSIIVFGTNGIWEATNPDGKRFGKARLCELICQNSHLTAKEIGQAIQGSLCEFARVDHFADDVTYVVVKLWLSS